MSALLERSIDDLMLELVNERDAYENLLAAIYDFRIGVSKYDTTTYDLMRQRCFRVFQKQFNGFRTPSHAGAFKVVTSKLIARCIEHYWEEAGYESLAAALNHLYLWSPKWAKAHCNYSYPDDKPVGFLVENGRAITDCAMTAYVSSDSPSPPPSPKEQQSMDTAKPIIENKTFIYGQDATQMTDEQIFTQIGTVEAEIKKLEAVENKPKKLQDKIDNMKLSIQKLVEYVDARV